MAEAAGAQQVPTFKLVLVGDGGTGKVGWSPSAALFSYQTFASVYNTPPLLMLAMVRNDANCS
jgi:hypothetical protein